MSHLPIEDIVSAARSRAEDLHGTDPELLALGKIYDLAEAAQERADLAYSIRCDQLVIEQIDLLVQEATA